MNYNLNTPPSTLPQIESLPLGQIGYELVDDSTPAIPKYLIDMTTLASDGVYVIANFGDLNPPDISFEKFNPKLVWDLYKYTSVFFEDEVRASIDTRIIKNYIRDLHACGYVYEPYAKSLLHEFKEFSIVHKYESIEAIFLAIRPHYRYDIFNAFFSSYCTFQLYSRFVYKQRNFSEILPQTPFILAHSSLFEIDEGIIAEASSEFSNEHFCDLSEHLTEAPRLIKRLYTIKFNKQHHGLKTGPEIIERLTAARDGTWRFKQQHFNKSKMLALFNNPSTFIGCKRDRWINCLIRWDFHIRNFAEDPSAAEIVAICGNRWDLAGPLPHYDAYYCNQLNPTKHVHLRVKYPNHFAGKLGNSYSQKNACDFAEPEKDWKAHMEQEPSPKIPRILDDDAIEPDILDESDETYISNQAKFAMTTPRALKVFNLGDYDIDQDFFKEPDTPRTEKDQVSKTEAAAEKLKEFIPKSSGTPSAPVIENGEGVLRRTATYIAGTFQRTKETLSNYEKIGKYGSEILETIKQKLADFPSFSEMFKNLSDAFSSFITKNINGSKLTLVILGMTLTTLLGLATISTIRKLLRVLIGLVYSLFASKQWNEFQIKINNYKNQVFAHGDKDSDPETTSDNFCLAAFMAHYLFEVPCDFLYKGFPRFITICKNITIIGTAATKLKDLMKLIQESLKWVLDTVHLWIYGYPREISHTQMEDLVINALKVLEDPKNIPVNVCQFYANKIEKLLKDMRTTSAISTVNCLEKLHASLELLISKKTSEDFTVRRGRVPTFACLFRGRPGKGKSTFVVNLAQALADHLLGGHFGGSVYHKDSSDPWWDGIRNALVAIIDDLGQKRDLAGMEQSEWLQLIKLVNVAPYLLPVADAQAKGEQYYNALFTFFTTNLDVIDGNNVQSIVCPDAVNRRFFFEVEVLDFDQFYVKKALDKEFNTLCNAEELIILLMKTFTLYYAKELSVNREVYNRCSNALQTIDAPFGWLNGEALTCFTEMIALRRRNRLTEQDLADFQMLQTMFPGVKNGELQWSRFIDPVLTKYTDCDIVVPTIVWTSTIVDYWCKRFSIPDLPMAQQQEFILRKLQAKAREIEPLVMYDFDDTLKTETQRQRKQTIINDVDDQFNKIFKNTPYEKFATAPQQNIDYKATAELKRLLNLDVECVPRTVTELERPYMTREMVCSPPGMFERAIYRIRDIFAKKHTCFVCSNNPQSYAHTNVDRKKSLDFALHEDEIDVAPQPCFLQYFEGDACEDFLGSLIPTPDRFIEMFDHPDRKNIFKEFYVLGRWQFGINDILLMREFNKTANQKIIPFIDERMSFLRKYKESMIVAKDMFVEYVEELVAPHSVLLKTAGLFISSAIAVLGLLGIGYEVYNALNDVKLEHGPQANVSAPPKVTKHLTQQVWTAPVAHSDKPTDLNLTQDFFEVTAHLCKDNDKFDSTLNHLMANVINHMGFLRVNQTKRGLTNCIFLSTNELIMPYHNMAIIDASTNIEIVFPTRGTTFAGLTFSLDECYVERLLDEKKDPIDGMYVRLPQRKFVPGMKDFIEKFNSIHEINQHDGFKYLVATIEREGDLVYPLVRQLGYGRHVNENLVYAADTGKGPVQFVIPKYVHVNFSVGHGHCFAPYLAIDPGNQSPARIDALHIAGKNGMGAGVIISKEELLRCRSRSVAGNVPQIFEAHCCTDPTINKCRVEDILYEFHQPPLDLNFVAKVDKAFVPTNTKIEKSPIGRMNVLPCNKAPAMLDIFTNKEGVVVDPWLNALKKYVHSPPQVDENVLEVAAADLQSKLMSIHDDTLKPEILSIEQACFGEPRIGLTSLDTTTAAGYYWQKRNPKGRGKKWLMNINTKFIHEDLRAKTIERIEKAKQGIILEAVFKDCLKDEKRPIEKVALGKTRLFNTSPVDLTLAVRMYFGAFMAWMMKHRIYTESAVGINPTSPEWDLLAQILLQQGDAFIAGDFGNYDGTLIRQFLMWFLSIINTWYNDGPVNCAIRTILWNTIVAPLHICKGYMYWNYCCNPSGNAMTVFINTGFSMLFFRYVWYIMLKKQRMTMTQFPFNQFVSLQVYGDDNIMGVHPRFRPFFTPALVAQEAKNIGMEYTDETKQGNITHFRSLKECTFLKRDFFYDKQYCAYIGRLDLATLLEIPNWKFVDTHFADMAMGLEQTIRELALYPPEIFNKWMKTIIEAARNSDPPYPIIRAFPRNTYRDEAFKPQTLEPDTDCIF